MLMLYSVQFRACNSSINNNSIFCLCCVEVLFYSLNCFALHIFIVVFNVLSMSVVWASVFLFFFDGAFLLGRFVLVFTQLSCLFKFYYFMLIFPYCDVYVNVLYI